MSNQKMFAIGLLLVGIIWGIYFTIPMVEYVGRSRESRMMNSGRDSHDSKIYDNMAMSSGYKAAMGLIIIAVGVFVLGNANRKEKLTLESKSETQVSSNADISVKQCASCHAEIAPGDLFCRKCGAKIT